MIVISAFIEFHESIDHIDHSGIRDSSVIRVDDKTLASIKEGCCIRY